MDRAAFEPLNVSPRDYKVDVAPDVGSTHVTIEDVRGGVDDFGHGKPVWAGPLDVVRDAEIAKVAAKVEERVRPLLNPEPTDERSVSR